jgi:hypothetical protein
MVYIDLHKPRLLIHCWHENAKAMKECELVSLGPPKGPSSSRLWPLISIPIRWCTRFELAGYFCKAKHIFSLDDIPTRIRNHFWIFLNTSTNKVMNKQFVAPKAQGCGSELGHTFSNFSPQPIEHLALSVWLSKTEFTWSQWLWKIEYCSSCWLVD